ncbi:FliC/FljB family flagellin [Pantoea eucrina]|uniref:Flagellin n=1 Tax=Pantoea eucrina TaxID=472693 RepID=A0ABS1Z0B0_9GAMM|nr:FliC/FljB family flagellin [Pantoea eucrina]AIX51469.1 flagellin [Pantoea sp. PSNIH1]MBM0745834.1 FliC/FljB family flagellin [Pantoea eucrina]UBB12011.1 FliC/FljB family flagellin [Pantoea eucrina]
MAQVINTNSLSLITQNNINKNQSALSSSMERLSSGLRINSAKDDAAGQAIANRFQSNIKGLTQAARNANDGISAAQTTEGALSEINNNLQRIRELTVQAQNGTNSDSDKSSIQDEIKSRLDEIDRVSQQTQFNGVNVLAKDGNMKIQVGANDGQTISIDLKKIDSNTLKLDNFNVTNMATTVKNGSTGNVQIAVTSAVSDDDNAAPETVTSLAKNSNGDYFATTSSGTYAATVDNKTGTISFDSSGTSLSPTGTTAVTTIGKDVTLDTTAVDAANKSLVTYKDEAGNDNYLVQTTDANGDSTYEAATINATTGAVTAGASVATPANFNANPLAKLDSAIADIDKFRSSLGAVQNRLNSAVTNLSNTTTNLTAAQSRIQDADYATEVSNMSKAQIVQQAGNSVLAKANQVPQQVLSLLQG